MLWRKLRKSDTWHFVKACSNWPKGKACTPDLPRPYVEQDWKPTTGELCDQCHSKLAALAKKKKLSAEHHATWIERVWDWCCGTCPDEK